MMEPSFWVHFGPILGYFGFIWVYFGLNLWSACNADVTHVYGLTEVYVREK